MIFGYTLDNERSVFSVRFLKKRVMNQSYFKIKMKIYLLQSFDCFLLMDSFSFLFILLFFFEERQEYFSNNSLVALGKNNNETDFYLFIFFHFLVFGSGDEFYKMATSRSASGIKISSSLM